MSAVYVPSLGKWVMYTPSALCEDALGDSETDFFVCDLPPNHLGFHHEASLGHHVYWSPDEVE